MPWLVNHGSKHSLLSVGKGRDTHTHIWHTIDGHIVYVQSHYYSTCPHLGFKRTTSLRHCVHVRYQFIWLYSSLIWLSYFRNVRAEMILPVLNDCKPTHNVMQPPLCLKIWKVVLSNVLYWICPKHNILYSGQKWIALPPFLQYYYSAELQTGWTFLEYLYSV
jgi:hypothetical protein